MLIIKEGKNLSAIQVCYKLDENNEKRELKGLLEALKELKLRSGLILTNNQEDELLIDDIKIVIKPAWKWMLSIK